MARRAGNRTSPTGSYRFDRVFRGVGRVQRSAGTTDWKEFMRRDAILTKLYETSQLETLRGVQRGEVSLEELVEADREDRLRQAASLLVLHRRLWDTVTATWPEESLTSTTKRYRVSFSALKAKLGAGENRMKIRDLEHIDWKDLRVRWGKSGSDWNHMRRAVSALLTKQLGVEEHPFRRLIMAKIPLAAEHQRVPDLTPELFWKVVAELPVHARPGIITLVATGMRVSEYLRCTPDHLQPATRSLRIPGQKTLASSDTIRVADSLWTWVEAAVPAPLQHGWLRKYWHRACKKVGLRSITLHDLRHCYGQWAIEGGAPESAVQVALRHASPAMTRRYVKQKERGKAAKAVERVLEAGK